jgi:hypothetical protein
MSWQYKSVCSSDAQVLFTEIKKEYPQVLTDGSVRALPWFLSFDNDTGTMVFNVRSSTTDSGSFTVQKLGFSLRECDDSDFPVNSLSVQFSDFQVSFIVAVMVVLFFLGFSNGRR